LSNDVSFADTHQGTGIAIAHQMHRPFSFICALSMFAGSVVPAGAANLAVTWDRSLDINVTGYLVSHGSAPGTYKVNVDAGNVTSIVLTNLADNATYYVVVRAYNSVGLFSSPSLEMSGRTGSSGAAFLTLSCPAPFEASSEGKPVSVTLSPMVTGGAVPIVTRCTPASGTLFGIGTTPFGCTATDAVRQTASCLSVVVVLRSSAPAPVSPLATFPGATTVGCKATDSVQQTASCAMPVTARRSTDGKNLP
jgi:hypothetical protein